MRAVPLLGDVRNVLCLGAHCDDVEIGCGGTLRTLMQANPQAQVHVVVFSGDSVRVAESRMALGRIFSPNSAWRLETHDFRDGFLPASWCDLKQRFEELKGLQPDLVFTHYERDRHQDHRTVCELTWNTFRDQLILEYEIPKWDGDLGQPAFYVPIAREAAECKTSALMEAFASQRQRPWFSADLFNALMRMRGMECNAASGYAEAFHVRKLVIE